MELWNGCCCYGFDYTMSTILRREKWCQYYVGGGGEQLYLSGVLF